LDIPTEGLEFLAVDARDLAGAVLARYEEEMAGVLDARTRVRGMP